MRFNRIPQKAYLATWSNGHGKVEFFVRSDGSRLRYFTAHGSSPTSKRSPSETPGTSPAWKAQPTWPAYCCKEQLSPTLIGDTSFDSISGVLDARQRGSRLRDWKTRFCSAPRIATTQRDALITGSSIPYSHGSVSSTCSSPSDATRNAMRLAWSSQTRLPGTETGCGSSVSGSSRCDLRPLISRPSTAPTTQTIAVMPKISPYCMENASR
jgi:hypothetical protein